MVNKMKENRVKILSIDQHLMVDILNWWIKPAGVLKLPITESIPEDATVISVNANWSRRTIEALIKHPSFDVVPNGEMPPMIPDYVTEFKIIHFKDLMSPDN